MEDITKVPVIIGSYEPFRLIFRDSDFWNPTLDDLNNSSYDYVKLHRLSDFLDVGIAPFSLGIGFDGSLILPAIEQFKNRDEALNKFNETLGILLFGGIYTEAMLPEDLGIGVLTAEGYFSSRSIPSGSIGRFHCDIQNKSVGSTEVIKLLSPKKVSNLELKEAYQKGKLIFEKIKSLPPNILLNGITFTNRGLWSDALIFLWTSVEQILYLIWQNEIYHESTINNELAFRKSILASRSWNVSSKIELLYQKSMIPDDLYSQLNTARKARNRFIHNGKKPNSREVKCALQSIFKLMSLIMTDYNSITDLDHIHSIVENHQQKAFLQQNKSKSWDDVIAWREIPPIPGDPNWEGDYEVIDELRLLPMEQNGNKDNC